MLKSRRRTGTPTPGRKTRREQLCSRCGHLLGAHDIVERVEAKQSQLARFGLGAADAALTSKSLWPKRVGAAKL